MLVGRVRKGCALLPLRVALKGLVKSPARLIVIPIGGHVRARITSLLGRQQCETAGRTA